MFEVVDYKLLDEVIEKYRINSVMLAIPDSSKVANAADYNGFI